MSADTELLRRYVEERSETAFAELVRLHLNLVYFAALRQLAGDAHRAQEVTQTVFCDLARKAATLTDRPTLTGWLHTSTRFAAAKLRRAEFSRQQRDQEAETMRALLQDGSTSAADWERLRPMVDDVVHELSERDRDAVLLRFFENRSFTEIGNALNVSEDAARMRVERALSKLHRMLTRRGIESTMGALACVLLSQAGAAPPAGLLATVNSAVLTSVPVGSGATTVVMGGAKTFFAVAAASLVVGASGLMWRQTSARSTPGSTAAAPGDRLDQVASDGSLQPSPVRAVTATASFVSSDRTEWRAAAELRPAGRASPRDTLETLMLALVDNDVDAFTAAIHLGPALQAKFREQLDRLSPEARERFGPVERLYALQAVERAGRYIPLVDAIRVLEQKRVGSDHAALRVQMQLTAGSVHERTLAFERSAGGWLLKLSEE